MPLKDEGPSSSGEEQGSDVESSSERCDSMTSASDLDCSRESFTSDCSSKHCSPSTSPPKTLTLEEVMESAKNLSNLRLAHEIAVNPNFRLEMNELPQDSLWKVVRDTVHKAFWDVLESELNDDPPEYGHAIRLLEEIREILLSFLSPGNNRMRTQIMEVLDMDLIRQQADNDAVDIQGLASFIISTMGKLCAQIRDEEIRKLRESTYNMVTLFREIFRVLDLMTADNVNYTITNLRTLLHRNGVEYERATFQGVLDKTPNALKHTTSWMRSALEELQSAAATTEQIKGQRVEPGPFQVLNTAFLSLLTWDSSQRPFPETLMTDEARLQEIQWQLQRVQAVNEVLLIVYSSIGEPIQGVSSLSERLKRMTGVLLEGMHSPGFKLEEALEGVSAQISCELNKSLTERGYPSLTPALQEALKGQICNITQKENPIRTLVEDRVQQYFKTLISSPKPEAKLEEVPAGLTAIKPELALIATRFCSLVEYNKMVYGPYYADIIRKLLFGDSPPAAAAAAAAAANTPQDAAQDSVISK